MVKWDIDMELEQLIEKHNLDRHYPAYRTSRRACEFIIKWIKRLSETEKRVLFVGMDEHALRLIADWARSERIDTLLVGSVEALEKHVDKLSEAEEIYIASYTRTIEILHWLWRHDFQAESVYDILENERVYLQMEFYRFFTPVKLTPELELDEYVEESSVDGSSLILYEYYYQKQRLNHASCDESKKRIAEKLFFLAVCMRNFLEAERILDTLLDSMEFKQFWREVQVLLGRVKEYLAEKCQNDIVIYWLDSLRYEESEKLKYLQSRREHSLYFHNAYAVTPGTNPTCKNMFCKIRQVEDLGYGVKRIDFENSPLLRDVIKQGYQLQVISGYLNQLFAPEFSPCAGIAKKQTCSEIFWRLVSQKVQNGGRKTVYLVHSFVELHEPMLSVRRERFERRYDRSSRDMQMEELDAQIGFYDGLIGNENDRIYMSDHGPYDVVWKRVHIHFQVWRATWVRRETKKMFCFLDFYEIMHRLLTGQDVNESVWNREYAPMEDVSYYNKKIIRDILKSKGNLRALIAYKGIVTKEGIYLRYKTGEELFYDGKKDAVDVQELLDGKRGDDEFFQELRQKAGEFPEELDSDPKFQYAAYSYKVYMNVKRTFQGIGKLLNEKFSAYADGGVALRMGGEHSRQLYELLTEGNKKKIGGIIDKNKQCVCAKLGVPIFEPGERLPDTMQAILLSSKIYLEELKEEAKSLYGELEVIDIYQYWEQAGYHFSRDFWFGQDVDYEVGFPED